MSDIPDQTALRRFIADRFPADVINELFALSRETAQHAHAPYSNFHVGAALRTRDGHTYGGCNMETPTFESVLCGERTGIFSAVTQGAAIVTPRFIDLVAVSCIDAHDPSNIDDGSPCGGCRQVIKEFGHPDTIIAVDNRAEGVLFRLPDFLPKGFRFGPETGSPTASIINIAEIEQEAESDLRPETLFRLSQRIAENSYVSLSGQRAGTIIITESGRAYAGVKVENSSAGLSSMPDRVAIGRAVINGEALAGGSFIKAIFTSQIDVTGDSERALIDLINPALLNEFCNNQTIVGLSVPGRSVYTTRNNLFRSVLDF